MCGDAWMTVGMLSPILLGGVIVAAVLMLAGVIPLDFPPVEVSIPFDWLVYAWLAAAAACLTWAWVYFMLGA